MEKGLTFDDILIVPQFSEVKSRKLVDVSAKLTRNISLSCPILSANMDTVTESRMATAMSMVGAAGVIHRFMSLEGQVSSVKRFKKSAEAFEASNSIVGVAVGVKGDFLERAILCQEAGASFVVVDIAHGHSQAVFDAIQVLKELNIDVIAGNVATADGARFLINAGADAVKCGVGGGSSCLTRVVAGVGVPQFSAIIDCALVCQEYEIPLIADGGIRYPGDVAKAMAAGANTVMVGNLLARTQESPGEVINIDGKLFKRFRGMASRGAMDTIKEINLNSSNGSAPEPREEHITPEGVEALVPYDGQFARDVVNNLIGGLRSAMSYSNSMNIEEFHQRAQFIPITNAGLIESRPHSVVLS